MASASRIRSVRYVIFCLCGLDIFWGVSGHTFFKRRRARGMRREDAVARSICRIQDFRFCAPLDVSFLSSLATRRCFSVWDPGVRLRGYLPLALFKTSLLDLSWRRERRTMGTRRTTHQLRAHATNILFLSITSDDNNSLRKRNAPSSATRLSRNRR